MSILSFPERGEGGDARYRGNCSPKVYEWLLKQARPRRLLDPVMGSGTSLDVALRSGIQAAGADLSTSPYHQALKARLERAGAQVHLGVDATRADLAGLFGPADLVVAHPAYGTQLVYSDDPRDMSQLGDDEVFYEALQALLVNMREATSVGGITRSSSATPASRGATTRIRRKPSPGCRGANCSACASRNSTTWPVADATTASCAGG
ncbi:hypothetical protein [Deinococcus multiflagellatus]|uniref:DNA methylase N-4/N-6 domain-containing protein n=1 Tax=Deinococcus multiflagellatus TaxID=1656887 RepID=A0ABW1ZP27_9DEIO